jgi:hypothetical protein
MLPEPASIPPRLRRSLFLGVVGAVLLFPGGLLTEIQGAWFRTAMNRRIARALASGQANGTILLDECVPFGWDRAVFFGPYPSPERLSELLGTKVSWRDVDHMELNDGINGFAFVSGVKLRLITFGRQRGRLDGVSSTRVFTPGRFRIAYRVVQEPGRSPEFLFDDNADCK